MQMFDRKWLGGLKRLGVVTELDARYMDDGRNVLAPFRPGWRWMNGRLEYTKRWEEEDRPRDHEKDLGEESRRSGGILVLHHRDWG